MNIHQLSVTYQPEQDRILGRISTTSGDEMQVWLTRRLMRGVWPILFKMVNEQMVANEEVVGLERPEVRQAVTALKREQFLQQADFGTPYKEAVAKPLGDRPLLVTEVQITPLVKGRLRLGFAEKLPGSSAAVRRFDIEAEASLLQGFLHLLEQAVAQGQWRESFDSAAQAAPAGLGLDDEAPPPGPRYLN